jgi:hypothetical protein
MAKFRSNKIQRAIAANSHNGRNARASALLGYNLLGTYHNANTNIDYWDSAGYPKKLGFSDLWNMQARFGIAKAGIMKPVDKSWQTNPTITDGENDGVRSLTDFEKDFEILVDKHHFFSRLKGADWRQRVGRYSAMLTILREQAPGKASDPVTKVNGIEAIIKLVPKIEAEVDVTDVGTITDINSEQHGMPTHYNLRQNVEGDRNPIDNQNIRLHPSRVFIFAEGSDDGSIFGIPTNEAGFNSLMDLEIICASGQTGLRKNAKQRFISSIKDNQVATALKDETLKAAYDKNVDEFNRGDSPNLTVYGMDITAMQSDLADPTSPFANSLNAYAASIGYPASWIIGVQMNKQASVGNENDTNDTIKSRRENYLTPSIVGYLNYLIDIGAMSKPKDKIIVTWDDLEEDTPGEKLDLGDKMSTINEKAFKAGRGEVFTIEEIRKTSGHEAEPEGGLEGLQEGDEDLPPLEK